MGIKFFEGRLSNLIMDNLLLKFAVVVIGLTQIFLGIKVTQAMKYQKTIIIPAGYDRRVVISGDNVSEDYVRMFTRNICNLAFNYSYSQARTQFGELLSYYDAEAFPAAKEMFSGLATTIETTKTGSTFVIYEPKVDAQKGIVSVKGVQKIYIDSAFVDTQQKTYLIAYKVVDGQFKVLSITDDKQQEKANGGADAGGDIPKKAGSITANPITNHPIGGANAK